jgi:serine/threonine-protein kinase
VLLLSAAATLVLLVLAVGGQALRHKANESTSGAAADANTNQPQSGSGSATTPSTQLTRYVTDPGGKLTGAGRSAVESALSKLYTRHNVHLRVAYVDDFSGLTPLRWADNTMRANGFTDTDGLLVVNTDSRTYAFRPPAVMTTGATGPRVNTDLIRKDRIAPAVRLHEWARAAVGAANGLEAAG